MPPPFGRAEHDGGYSGGTTDRPALERLLSDVDLGRIDCVVVYKVDRLSRSLLDFSKIVEVFERSGVSFVSVTQQFNTTTSMGRLTPSILLSFAQLEREIIGERIRDKVATAASAITRSSTSTSLGKWRGRWSAPGMSPAPMTGVPCWSPCEGRLDR